MEQKQIEQKKSNKIRCNKCGSTLGYLRIKDQEWVCRNCGHEEKFKMEEKR
jgi:ribosomal protein L37AE/L43A